QAQQTAALPAWTPIPVNPNVAKLSIIGLPHQVEGFKEIVWNVQFSPNGKYLLGAGDSSAKLWEAQTGKVIGEFPMSKAIGNAVFSPDGKTIATVSEDGLTRLWDAQTGKEIRRFPGNKSIGGVAFSPDGKYVVTGSGDNLAHLWDTQTGQETGRFEGHQGFVKSVAFSPDGKYVLTGSWDGTVRLWDAQTQKQGCVFKGAAA